MISSTNRKAGPYTANGANQTFPFYFKVFTAADVNPILTNALGVESPLPGATVNLNANQDVSPGGTVVCATPPAAGNLVTITSNVLATQPMQLTNGGGFFPRVLNDSADRITIILQQIQEKLSRTLSAPVSSNEPLNALSIPSAAARAGKLLAFDVLGALIPVSSASGPGDGGLRTDLAQPTGAALVGTGLSGGLASLSGFIGNLLSSAGAAALGYARSGGVARTVASKLGEIRASVLDYGAVGDGVANDTAAIQAAIDANKGGVILFPAGKTYLCAGVVLSGPTYDNTCLVIQGTILLKASGGVANWNASTSPAYVGVVVHNCDGVTIDGRTGFLDGNRANQTAWQQHLPFAYYGATNFKFLGITAREVRGDVVTVTSMTNLSPLTKNSQNGYIGNIFAQNSAYDGRNVISIISCDGGIIENITSLKIGGTINGEPMPGGIDFEADGAWHSITNWKASNLYLDHNGQSGLTCIGASKSGNDANQDWNTENIEITNFTVVTPGTAPAAQGPIFKRVRNLSVTGNVKAQARVPGLAIDNIIGLFGSVRINYCSIGATLGYDGMVSDIDFSIYVTNHTAVAVQTIGVSNGTLRCTARQPQGAGTYCLQIAAVGVRALTYTNMNWVVDCPYNGNLSGGVLVSPGSGSLVFGEGAVVTGRLTGYIGTSGQASQFVGAVPPISRDIEGRHFRSALPTAGQYIQGEKFWITNPTASGPAVYICTQTGSFSGTAPVFKQLTLSA